MTARAANVSAQLRASGFALTNTQRWYQGGPGIRVSQVGDEVRVQVRSTDPAQTRDVVELLKADLCERGYRVKRSDDPDNPVYTALWIKREDTSESKTAG